MPKGIIKKFSKKLSTPTVSTTSPDGWIDTPRGLEECLLAYIVAEGNQKKSGAQPSSLDHIAAALRRQDKYKRIAELVKKEWCEPKSTLPLRIWEETCLLDCKDWAKAGLLLNALILEHPDEPLLYLLLVKTCLRCKPYDTLKAVQSARHALAVCVPGTPDWLSDQCKKALAVALSAAAALAPDLTQPERANNRKEAGEVLVSVLERQQHDAIILYNLGLLYAESRQYSLALKHARGALSASQGTFGPAWALVALILSGRRQLKSAAKVMEGSLSECSPLFESLLVLVHSRLLVASGSSAEGVQVLADACKRFKKREHSEEDNEGVKELEMEQNRELWGDLSWTYLEEGRMEDAEFCLSKLEKLSPCSADCLYIAGLLKQLEGSTPEAIEKFEMARALDPNHSASALSLGSLYRVRGEEAARKLDNGVTDLVLAQSLLSDCLRQEPDNHVGWYNLGLVCKAQGRIEEAKKYLQNAVSLAATAPVKSFSILPRIF